MTVLSQSDAARVAYLASERRSLQQWIGSEQRELAVHLGNHRWYTARVVANRIADLCSRLELLQSALDGQHAEPLDNPPRTE